MTPFSIVVAPYIVSILFLCSKDWSPFPLLNFNFAKTYTVYLQYSTVITVDFSFGCWGRVRQVQALVEGEATCMPRAEHVTKKDVVTTCGWLIDKVNEAIGEVSESNYRENQQLLQAFVSGEVDEKTLASSWKYDQRKMNVKQLNHFAQKFLKKKHITKQSTNTAGNYLEFDDEKMVRCLV